jgi:hypothetical protein
MQDVPKIVRQQLMASAPAAAESHPDADLLTAFAEHSLTGAEHASVIDHLARCADCRNVVALALPATETVALPAASGARLGWLSWPVLRWGVVAAGVLAVTSIGVVQYRQRHQEKTVASNFAQRNTRADTAAQNSPMYPQAPAPQAAAPQTRMERDALTALPSHATSAKRKAAPSRQNVAVAKASASPALAQQQSPPPVPTQQVRVGSSSEVVEVQSEGAEATTQVTVQNQVQDRLIQNQKELPSNGRNFTNLDAVAKAKNPVPAQAVGGSMSAPPPAPPSIPLQISPSLLFHASPRWVVSSAGTLQRSFDGGKTWEDINPSMNLTSAPSSDAVESTASTDQYSAQEAPNKKNQKAKVLPNSGVVFRAVASAGLEVWAGGSAGALYHTADGGNRWTLVLPSAPGSILTGDIISIQFPDPQHGTVATSNAEVWTTADNGQTWHKQE